MVTTQKLNQQRDTVWALFLTFALFAAVMLVPDLAHAGDIDDALSKPLCELVGLITGTTGRAIATIAIIVIGVGALMGKISWGMAIIVALGIAIVFGAGAILESLGTEVADGECGAA